jgi:hypothetical protein
MEQENLDPDGLLYILFWKVANSGKSAVVCGLWIASCELQVASSKV